MPTTRYTTLATDFARTHRPNAWATTQDRRSTYERIGEEIQAEITRLRDEILGPPRPNEPIQHLLRRTAQATATAEELTLRHHPAFQPEPSTDPSPTETDDPILATYQRHLATIHEAIDT